jgi:hypothetical protein
VPPIAVKPKPAPPAAPKPTPIHYPEVTLIGPGRIWKVGSKQEPPLPAKADDNVEFVNKTSETVKVCFYKSSAITDVYPTSCSDIVSGDQLGLNRGGETYPLHVRVFRPGIIDTLLCTGQFVGNPLWVYIDGGCTVRVVERIQHLRSWQQQDTHLVVCNRFAKERVRFAIGSFVELVRGGADRVLDVEGWYLVLPGECKSFSMTFRLRKVRDPSWTAGAGQPPYAFYIYGETVDAFWGGDADDPEYCAQQEGNFHYSVDPAKSGECAGPNQKRIRFRPVTSKSESIRNPLSHYYWNF